MRFRRASLCIVATTLVVAGWMTSQAFSQGSGSSRTEQPRAGRIIEPPRASRPQTQEEFVDTFWRFIVKKDAAYNTWQVLKRENAEDSIDNPHGEFTKTYANKVAADNPTGLPDGSILVREDYDTDQKRVSISVMYRVKDYYKEHGNWYWMKFLENGTAARTSKEDGNKLVAGKVTSCVACHAKATGKDFVFSNLPPSDATGKDQQ
jgi:cytochrome c553